jgi:hypothetical protein
MGVAPAFVAISAEAGPGITFQEPRVLRVDSPARVDRIASGDWNGDGRTDLAALSGQVYGSSRVTVPALPGSVKDGQYSRANRGGRSQFRWPNRSASYHCTEDSPKCVPSGTFSAFLSEGDFRCCSASVPAAGFPRPTWWTSLQFLVADLNSDRSWITDRLENILQPAGT